VAPSRARAGFDEQTRRAIIDRYRAAFDRQWKAEIADDAETERAASAEMKAAVKDYVDGVPIMAISRDPWTGDVFETSLDTHGLDGLWWAYEREYRPWVDPPPGFFAWTGALAYDGPLPEWTMKAMPGPEVPFVLPRILEHPDIKAVISSVLIGEHVGFPVVYFARGAHPGIERVDDWGHRSYTYLRADGSPTSEHSVQDDDEKDFDLGPWLDSGKLLWIAPGDASLTLRTGREDCPFLGLEGERRRRYLQEGKTWLA
jgi:hypothetical protein